MPSWIVRLVPTAVGTMITRGAGGPEGITLERERRTDTIEEVAS